MAGGHGEIVSSPGVHELFSLINVGVVVVIVIVFARKGIQELFKSRSQKLREDLVLTREELKKISLEIEASRASLANIEKEKVELIKKIEEEGNALARRLIDEANVSAQTIRDDSLQAVSAEFEDIRAKLKAELLDSLVKKVREEFQTEGSRQKLHDKLLESFLSREATQ